jgi:hypothetical protein
MLLSRGKNSDVRFIARYNLSVKNLCRYLLVSSGFWPDFRTCTSGMFPKYMDIAELNSTIASGINANGTEKWLRLT